MQDDAGEIAEGVLECAASDVAGGWEGGHGAEEAAGEGTGDKGAEVGECCIESADGGKCASGLSERGGVC